MRNYIVLILLCITKVSMASDVLVQMVTLNDVQNASSPGIYEGISNAPAGSIYFPDQILAAQIDNLEGDARSQLKNWKRTHRFMIIPFSISIRPNDENIPERVDVTLALESSTSLNKQPALIDVFPPNGFHRAPFEGKAGLEVGAEGTLTKAASAKANFAFSYTYSPAYANVVSGIGSTHAFWQYRRTQDNYPVGEIPMKLLMVVPRNYKSAEIIGYFDVNVDFGGSFFIGKSARAQFTSVIALPE